MGQKGHGAPILLPDLVLWLISENMWAWGLDTLVDELFCDNFFFPRRGHFQHGWIESSTRHGGGGRGGVSTVMPFRAEAENSTPSE